MKNVYATRNLGKPVIVWLYEVDYRANFTQFEFVFLVG